MGDEIIELWLDEPSVLEVEVGLGIPVQGPIGPAGSGGDLNFLYTQVSPSAVWVIVHNLNKYPTPTVSDSAGSVVHGSVHYDSVNQLTITFAGGFSGFATLN